MKHLLDAVARWPLSYAVGVFVFGVIILFLGQPATGLLAAGVVVALIAATIATVYLRNIYLRQPEPRPVFFRMLVAGSATKVAGGAIVGYIAVAFLTRNSDLPFGIVLPLPPASTAILAYIVIVLLTPPVYYAITVWNLRSRARRVSSVDDVDLDVGGHSQGEVQ